MVGSEAKVILSPPPLLFPLLKTERKPRERGKEKKREKKKRNLWYAL
jgi:hypothetical protein